MGILDKIKNIQQRIRIAGAVSKIVLGGKSPNFLDKIEKGNEIADKSLEIASLVKDIIKKR